MILSPSPVAAMLHVVLADPQPPSVNKLYSPGLHGTMRLTSEGKAYKDALKEVTVSETQRFNWKEMVDEVYLRRGFVTIHIGLYLEFLFNGAWKPGGRTKGGAIQSPYQKVDGTNYIKVIEDGLVQGTGIDDSVHLDVQVSKSEDKVRPRVEILYMVHRRGLRTDHAE